jgi:hypothetical protein
MADAQAIWVCAGCRSVNKLRAKQCYNCRTPKHRAAVDPSQIDPTTKGQIRDVALPAFRSSRSYAVVASILILVTAIGHAIFTLTVLDYAVRIADGFRLSYAELWNLVGASLTTFGIALIALIGWALWLSKAVREMPALGLGYPAVNGLMAFWENFIPIFNLWRVPAIVRDIVERLEPRDSKARNMISAAWLGLIGGYLLPFFGDFINGIVSRTFAGYVRNHVILELVSLGLVLTSSVLLIVLIWWIEVHISRRRTALAKAGLVATTVAGSASAAPSTPPVATIPGPLGSVVVAAASTPDPESSAGPRLDLTIADDGSMVATLNDESEPITIEDLLETAAALARADGWAVVGFGDGTPEVTTVAGQAMRILADAGVLATVDKEAGYQTTG